MARKTQVFTQIPWTGGLNSALDPGVISANDLQQADNIVFSSNGARIKREGWSYLDKDLPQPVAISSSGTTRTLIFDEQINTTANDFYVAGEAMSFVDDSGSYAPFTANANVATVTNFGADGGFGPSDVDTGPGTITITAHGYYTGQVGQFTTSGALPTGLSLTTDYYVIVVDANTIKVSNTLQGAIDGLDNLLDDGGSGSHTFVPNIKTNNALTYTATGSLTLSATYASGDISVTRNYSNLGVYDYWYLDNNLKTREIVQVTSQPKFFTFDTAGNRKEIAVDVGATAFVTTPTKVNFLVAVNTLIMSFDGVGNVPRKYAPVTDPDIFDLANAPDFEVAQLHQGRVFANDKTDPDRLHYSSPLNIEEWGGAGDSAALDVDQGDGDSEGIIAIAKPFKGRMFFSKGRKIYDLRGDSPENYKAEIVTEGLGMVSQAAIVAVDVDDLMFLSKRGAHSLIATDTQGDFESSFLSAKIQPTYNLFTEGRLKFSSGAYIPSINSILFSVSDQGSSENNNIYAYNTVVKEWYRWTDADAQYLTVFTTANGKVRPMWGNSVGRIVLANNGTYSDFTTTATNYEIKTGTIYPNNDPKSLKMFKRISLYFKPTGDFTFTCNYKIDQLSEQQVIFEQAVESDLLGVSFILGASTLGTSGVFAPQTRPIDGIGRGIQLRITSNDAQDPIEIYGYDIEYENADINQEVV